MRYLASRVSRPMVVLLGTLGALSLAGGCKTDALSGPERKAPVAPTVDLESPAGIEVPNIKVADRSEVDLVEELLLHRAMYARLLRALNTYYTEHGNEPKAIWARTELNDLKRVKPYRYILDAEPVSALTPTESIAEADKLYDEGLALMKKGGHGVPVFYNQETMKRALAKFMELVNKHPTSDKIDDAAFMIAEIHKEYFEEKDNTVAIEWYKRSLAWNPKTPHPVRFQMAVCYDYRMHEREKALEMYQQVLAHEQFNKSNVAFANERIRQLTTEKTRHAPGEATAATPPEPAAGSPAGEAAPASPPAPTPKAP